MNARSRTLALGLVTGAAIFLLASCTGSTAATPPDDASASSTPSSSPPPADLHSFAGVVIGKGDLPRYTIQAPKGWSQYEQAFTVKDSGVDVMGVSVWDVGKVPLDPCNWRGAFQTPGPTINDLVAALEAQRGRHTTSPTRVTFLGYPARRLEWSTPKNATVTGDGDFAGCDAVSNGHTDYIGWLGKGGVGERYAQVAGQTDRMWIFMVNGQRLLVDETFSPDATPAQIEEMTRVTDSLRFT